MPTPKGTESRDTAKTSLPEQVRQWISSTEGQAKLSEAVKQAVEVTNRLREAQRIDPKMLHEPMTL